MSTTAHARAHDKATYRRLPIKTRPLDHTRVAQLTEVEWAKFRDLTPGSAAHAARAEKTIPLGVPSSFQHWEPYPIAVVSARGSHLVDVDGRDVLDLSMGFGAMLAGHLNPVVVRETTKALTEQGTLFVTPSPLTTEVAELFAQRFGVDQIRFANSGTEADMYIIRLARTVTGKQGVVKIEGGYHGGYDPLLTSVKPALDEAGPDDAPVPVHVPGSQTGPVFVVPYNDLDRLRTIFTAHKDEIAVLLMEPVLENISIVLPDEGYLQGVRQLCDEFGIILAFDEVKTGLTAGHRGAAHRLGVQPDLSSFAKSIGGGLPLAAFGGKAHLMTAVTDGRMAHMGTYNGNPLTMAAARAIDEICTAEALESAEARNHTALTQIADIIDEFELPAHVVGFGVKGAITWAPEPVRNYRDYKRTDFETAELAWLWGINRGILTPPGLDEQWLVSLAHTSDDMNKLVSVFRELAQALRA